MFLTALMAPVSAFSAPMSMLFEMFSRWPRNLSHGPAMEMWSVVHLPLALMSTGRPVKSPPCHASNGASSCRRDDLGSTATLTPAPDAGGLGLVDTFRAQFPKTVGYTYYGHRAPNARAQNKGWRLDYFLVSAEMAPLCHDAYILKDVEGSDHVPLGLVLRK